MRQHPLLMWLLQAAMFFFLLKLVAGLPGGVVIVTLLVVVAIMVAVILWMLKYRRATAAGLYQTTVGRWIVGTVCRLSQQQPPVDLVNAEEVAQSLALRTTNDFAQATRLLMSSVYGHDQAISDLMLHLQKSVLLRQSQTAVTRNLPIGIHVLAGPSGFGKRTLSLRLGQVLHVRPSIQYYDLADLQDVAPAWSALFGDASRPGQLSGAISDRPFQTVIFDNLNRASAPFLERLAKVLAAGRAADGQTGRAISFEHCLFVFLWHGSLAGMSSPIGDHGANPSLTDTLLTERGVPVEFVRQVQQLVTMPIPSRLDQAKVIASLMRRECQKFEVELSYVAPEILVHELQSVADEHGFAAVPNRLTRLLTDPLLRAARTGQRRLVLEQPQLSESVPATIPRDTSQELK